MGILDKAKDMAGKAKDVADVQVDKHGDRIPDEVENAYDRASDAAEKALPGDDAAPKLRA